MVTLLVFKSMLVEVYDYRQADISPYLASFTVDETQCQKDLEAILYRYGKKERVETVSTGDLVKLGYSSPFPRFNRKKMATRVGEGKLPPELERILPGMNVGESKTVKIGAVDVTLSVQGCVHTTYPELTDASVAAFGMEGVSTVADLRRYCVNRQIETFVSQDESVDAAVAHLWKEIAANTPIAFDPEELAFVHDKAEKKYAEVAGSVVETPDGQVPITLEMLKTMYETELSMAVIGERMMLAKEHTCLTEDDYCAHITQDADGQPEKQLTEFEGKDGRMDYMIDEYSNYVARALEEYIAGELKARHAKE